MPDQPRPQADVPLHYEEMDDAKHTLPPVVPIAIGLLIVIIALGVILAGGRADKGTEAWLGAVTAVEQREPGRVLAVLPLTVKNTHASKPLYIRLVKAELQPAQGEPLTDEAAPASDHARIFEGYPELAQHGSDPLRIDAKIVPGQTSRGIVIVGFPLSKADFDQRQRLRVTVELYDRTPLVIEEKR